jgi:lipopolysaccharide biosynthesis glycosyltransferase
MDDRIRTASALVLAADEGFALPLAVATHSALANLSPGVPVELYVLDNGLSESSRTRLVEVVDRSRRGQRLHWISVPTERLADIVISDNRFTAASYSRLFAAELVREQVKRVVYLDVDVLVRGDLSPLFSVELDGAPFGAVLDFGIPSTANDLSGVRERSNPRPYFNAGMLVIDVPRWKQAGLTARALEYASTGTALPLVDQDALNAVAGEWHQLSYRWNFQQTLFWGERRPRSATTDSLFEQRWALYRDAAVVHFVGGPKPWHPLCPLPGTTPWVRAMVSTRWHRRDRALAFVLGYLRRRARYRLGTAGRDWGARLRQTRAGWSDRRRWRAPTRDRRRRPRG